jgi:DNA modification methylase
VSDWVLNLGDCIEGMRTLADDSVDVTITDPPYDDHTHNAGRRGATSFKESASGQRRAEFNRNRDLGFDSITQEQMSALMLQWRRVTRRWVNVFCSIEMVGDPNGIGWRGHGERAGLQYVRTAFWHKIGATPQFTGDRPANAAEAIAIFHRPGRKRWNGGGRHGWYEHEADVGISIVYEEPIVLNRGGSGARLHTTQKPLALMESLVADFSDPGELILDPFAGSGTTGVACRQLGRRFIGWELNAEYHAIATRRLNGDEARPREHQPSLDFGGV